jgi:hypothetical protein
MVLNGRFGVVEGWEAVTSRGGCNGDSGGYHGSDSICVGCSGPWARGVWDTEVREGEPNWDGLTE